MTDSNELYIVEHLVKYPDPNAKCITKGEGKMITTLDGRKYKIDCTSPICPKHAQVSRSNWVDRIVKECNKHEHNLTVYLPLNYFLPQDEMSKVWRAFYNSIYYSLPEFRHCFVIEIQNEKPHIHGFIHSNYEIDTEVVKKAWTKMLKKHSGADVENMKTQFSAVNYARGIAEYVMKSNEDSKVIQLPPRGWLYRIIKASHYYGMDK